MLDDRIASQLRERYERRISEGSLPSEAQLGAWYATFRERFAPEVLQRLDGEALLNAMHLHGSRDSMVYWLEFKNDEEFPNIFGSIAGGSALKFGIYRSSETGQWMTGSPQRQRVLTLDEAVERARQHRDQLVRAAGLVAALPDQADNLDYIRLQADLEREAPDIHDTAWGHKYINLLFPQKLDDFHVIDFQRHHLIKLLQVPPVDPGRYRSAGRFVAIARSLGMHLSHLTMLLHERDGRPHRYWRIGTSDGTDPMNRWPPMLEGRYVAIGWHELGDLSELTYDRQSKERVKALAGQTYSLSSQAINSLVSQVFNFVAAINPGELVVAASGTKNLAIGRVTGAYGYDPSDPADFPHRHPVEWLHVGEFSFPTDEGLQSSVRLLGKHFENLVAIETHLLSATQPPPPAPKLVIGVAHQHITPTLAGIPGRIQGALARKGQVILYGPPGTGKTHWAEQAARDLAAYTAFGASFAALTPTQQRDVIGDSGQHGLVRMCTFHPAYGYEDFLEGYRPLGAQGGFALRPGVFKSLCADATNHPEQRYYLIIDEINRGDIPRILGELLTVLEKSKRGRAISLPLSGAAFAVPENVYVIGTMNTADRSIALLDTALRRRFGFIELMPDSTVLESAALSGIPLGPWLDALNRHILDHIGRDARNLQIGHSYLMHGAKPLADFASFARAVREDILPLLEEYCYEDYAALEKILGKSLVDAKGQRIRHELFAQDKVDELVQALLQIDPQIATTPVAVAAEANLAPDSEADDNDGEG